MTKKMRLVQECLRMKKFGVCYAGLSQGSLSSCLFYPSWSTKSGSLETVTADEAHGGLLSLVKQWLHGGMHWGMDLGDQPGNAKLLRSRYLLVL